MTKRDYQAIAGALYRATRPDDPRVFERRGETVARVVSALADMLAADNPRFDRATFVAACETGDVTRRPKRKGNLRIVDYRTRDLGAGVEEGTIVGVWGSVDTWGKRELTPEHGNPLYLFADEVVTDDQA